MKFIQNAQLSEALKKEYQAIIYLMQLEPGIISFDQTSSSSVVFYLNERGSSSIAFPKDPCNCKVVSNDLERFINYEIKKAILPWLKILSDRFECLLLEDLSEDEEEILLTASTASFTSFMEIGD